MKLFICGFYSHEITLREQQLFANEQECAFLRWFVFTSLLKVRWMELTSNIFFFFQFLWFCLKSFLHIGLIASLTNIFIRFLYLRKRVYGNTYVFTSMKLCHVVLFQYFCRRTIFSAMRLKVFTFTKSFATAKTASTLNV